jgi:single-stranded DNA-binding protein
MCFFTIQATRDGGSDFLPVKAFGVPETVIAALVKGADARVLGRLQAGKYDKEKKAQLYDNIVVAEEIQCAGAYWNASAVTTAPAATAALAIG